MNEMIIDIGSELILKLAIFAITALFGWLEIKIGKNKNLANINAAKNEVKEAAIQTAGELQQKFVDTWKAQAVDGKLTEEQIALLMSNLLVLTVEKLSSSAIKTVKAARIDLDAFILGEVDAWIQRKKTLGELIAE